MHKEYYVTLVLRPVCVFKSTLMTWYLAALIHIMRTSCSVDVHRFLYKPRTRHHSRSNSTLHPFFREAHASRNMQLNSLKMAELYEAVNLNKFVGGVEEESYKGPSPLSSP